MTPLTLHIEGMSCGHCLNAVNKTLRSLDGVDVQSVHVGRAEVSYDESRLDPDRIAAAVTAEGYRASVQLGR